MSDFWKNDILWIKFEIIQEKPSNVLVTSELLKPKLIRKILTLIKVIEEKLFDPSIFTEKRRKV